MASRSVGRVWSEKDHLRACEAASYSSSGMMNWESDKDELVADLWEDMFRVLDQLEYRDMRKRTSENAILV